jgi:hypothetical protein
MPLKTMPSSRGMSCGASPRKAKMSSSRGMSCGACPWNKSVHLIHRFALINLLSARCVGTIAGFALEKCGTRAIPFQNLWLNRSKPKVDWQRPRHADAALHTLSCALSCRTPASANRVNKSICTDFTEGRHAVVIDLQGGMANTKIHFFKTQKSATEGVNFLKTDTSRSVGIQQSSRVRFCISGNT